MLILKSNYIKNAGKHGKNYVNYIGTRDKVEKEVQKYVDYIANRKGVEKYCQHGLFTSGNDKIVMSKVQEEIANHKGNMWLPIISLTREDAVKTGFDKGVAWKNLLSKLAPKIAEYYKINIDNFCWYASFHDEGHHPHVHMIVYSKDENEGFLTKKGIEKFKTALVKEVFSLELEEIYKKQTMQRDELKAKCKEIFRDIKIENSPELLTRILDLKQSLKNHKGKKSYGYLKKNDKENVDEIINKLEKIPKITEIYDLWYEMRYEIYGNYSNEKPTKLRLSEQSEFRSIKNMIIKEIDNFDIKNYQKEEFVANKNEISNNFTDIFAKLEKIFTDEAIKVNDVSNQRIDKKSFSKLIEKKEAKGQKHTGEDLDFSMKM